MSHELLAEIKFRGIASTIFTHRRLYVYLGFMRILWPSLAGWIFDRRVFYLLYFSCIDDL